MIEYREVKAKGTTPIYDCFYQGQDLGTLLQDPQGVYYYMAGMHTSLTMEMVKDISFKLHALNWRSR